MINLFHQTPLSIVDAPARRDHYTPGRTGPISAIVVHATAGTSSLAWLRTDSPRGEEVSAHRLITKAGVIYKIVADEDTAWHAGPSQPWQTIGPRQHNMNSVSLGLELENLNTPSDPYPAQQLLASAAQIVEWWGTYGFLPLLRHYEIQANKTDPQHLPWAQLQKLIWSALRAVR